MKVYRIRQKSNGGYVAPVGRGEHSFYVTAEAAKRARGVLIGMVRWSQVLKQERAADLEIVEFDCVEVGVVEK